MGSSTAALSFCISLQADGERHAIKEADLIQCQPNLVSQYSLEPEQKVRCTLGPEIPSGNFSLINRYRKDEGCMAPLLLACRYVKVSHQAQRLGQLGPEVLQALDNSSVITSHQLKRIALIDTHICNVFSTQLPQLGVQPEVSSAVSHHLLNLCLAFSAEACLLTVLLQAFLCTSISRLDIWAELQADRVSEQPGPAFPSQPLHSNQVLHRKCERYAAYAVTNIAGSLFMVEFGKTPKEIPDLESEASK